MRRNQAYTLLTTRDDKSVKRLRKNILNDESNEL